MLGAPGENSDGGAIYVVPGEDIAASGDLDDTTLHIKGSVSYGCEVGREVVDNLDLDGDGQDDLLFGYLPAGAFRAPPALISLLERVGLVWSTVLAE